MGFFSDIAKGVVSSVTGGLGHLFMGTAQSGIQSFIDSQAIDKQNEYNIALADRQNKYNMDLAKYQNAYNTEMWERQNKYNSPSETIERLVDAGVNPRAYNNIGQFANANTPAPSQGYPSVAYSKTARLSAYQDVVRKGLENSLLHERILSERKSRENIDSQINYRTLQGELTNAQATLISNKSLTENDKRFLTMFQALVYCAENGINPDDFGYGPRQMIEHNGRLVDGGSIFSKQALTNLLNTFSSRLDIRISTDEFLRDIRKFESYTKEDQFKILKKYGLDSDSSDSIMGLSRWFLRLFENTN